MHLRISLNTTKYENIMVPRGLTLLIKKKMLLLWLWMFEIFSLLISLCCLSARIANVVTWAGRIELTSNAAVLLSRNRSLRRVILKPHIHTVASPVRQSRSTLDHLCVSPGQNLFDVLTFSLVKLVGCLQTSPASLDSVSGSVESCFLHLFKHSFELLVVLSLSTINLLLRDLQQKSCIGHRQVLFFSCHVFFFFCLYCHVGRASARNVFQPGRNDWNWTCLHGLYFLVDQNYKSLQQPSQSDWKWVPLRLDRISFFRLSC